MDPARRRALATLGSGALAALAGCVAGYRGDGGGEAGGRVGPATRAGQAPDLPLPESAFDRGAPRDGIAAIVDPAFAPDWSGVEIPLGEDGGNVYRPRLGDEELVIGVRRGGRARAYPLKVLGFHEVVNDHLGGPLLVTYCPRCRSALVARRRVAGEPARFGVSGLLWRDNMVLYDDATGSLWSQLLARAVHGPRTGDRLAQLPSSLTTWGDWRAANPDTAVLLPPPRSGTVVGEVRVNYDFDLVRQQREAEAYLESRGLEDDEFDDTRLPKRELVLGVAVDGPDGPAARAYQLRWLDRPLNDRVGGVPVAVLPQGGSAVAYHRRVEGEVLTFDATDEPGVVRAGGSRWDVAAGRALDGPHEGRRLRQANAHPPLFWFAWLDFHPRTGVWTGR